MAMGTRKKRQRQENLWYGGELATAPGHPFYTRLNEVLDAAGFDSFCETQWPVSITIDSDGRHCLPANISAS